MAQTLDRAVEADEIVAALRGYGFTQADVARAVGVSDRAVRNWSQEGSLRRRNEERLHELRQIVLLLDDSLSRRGVGQWFRTHNHLLEGRQPCTFLPTVTSRPFATRPRPSPTAPTPDALSQAGSAWGRTTVLRLWPSHRWRNIHQSG